MIRLFHKLTGFYLASWLVLLWSTFVFITGAAVMFSAVVAACPPQVQKHLAARLL